jgi:iron complex outermembrane receptor protein
MDYGALEQLFGEPVTTSATGSPQRVTEVPSNMEIITADEIRRSGANNIPGVLRHVAGIDVLQWTSDESDVGVRGYDQVRSPRLLVLIDGRQVYADFYGYTPWSTLPVELSAIRQIEIVKGPNCALFGFNAVGGVINIITFNPLYDDVNTVSATGGNDHLSQGSGVATFRLADVTAWRISAGGRRNDDFSTPIPPASAGSPRLGENRAAIDVDGVIRLSDRVQLEIDVSHTHANQVEIDPLYTFSYERYVANSARAMVTADTGFGLVQATAYTNWIKDLDTATPGENPAHFGNQVSVAKIQDIFKLGSDHTFRLSAEYRYDHAPTVPVTGAHVFYDVTSAAGMWDWKVSQTVAFTNALRVDRLSLGREGYVPANYPLSNADWNRSYTEASFNSGLVWKADLRDTVRLTAARGVQIPSLISVGAYLSVDPPVTGVPTLRPTIVMNYELGWDRTLPWLGAQWRASAFHQQSDDLATVEAGTISAPGATTYFAQSNVGSSTMNGLELKLSGTTAQVWRWGMAYRYEVIRDHFDPIAQGGATFLEYQHTTPAHVIIANLGWAPRNWELDAYLHYQSSMQGLTPSALGFGTVLAPIDAYLSADVRVGYRPIQWVTLALSGKNILYANQRQTSGPSVEPQVFASATVDF